MKSKNTLYLLNEDIEKLIDRYEEIYKKAKKSENFSDDQLKRIQEILLQKFDFEIEELSAYREVEYKRKLAEIKAKNKEQIPWRRCWLWRLIFRPTTNRPQDIIEEQAALEAEKLFTGEEQELEERAKIIYGNNSQSLSKRKRKKILKKYLRYKNMLEDLQSTDNVAVALEKLEAALRAAEETSHPFDEPQDKPQEQPKEPDKEPPKPRRRRKSETESTAAALTVAPQLKGQLKMDLK